METSTMKIDLPSWIQETVSKLQGLLPREILSEHQVLFRQDLNG